jgi:antitoxin (DNA-binding transcriptional repressor) of toxin-antitoxin stability system
MSKTVTVEELRERPDELIAAIERGEMVTILEDGNAIGTYSPLDSQRGVKYPFRNLHITPLDKPLGIDPVEALIEDRNRERSGKKYGL